MTRYTGNEPIEPFHVPAKTIRCSASSGEMPGGSGSTRRPTPRTPSPLEELGTTRGRVVVAALLVAAYFLVHLRPMFSAITVLVLLGAVMYRLDPRQRRIAAAPITLASTMLASQIVASGIDYPGYGILSLATMPDGAIVWVPLFLAACLVYAPDFPTYTQKILTVISLLVLGSGLLPGRGFVAIFATTQYFLFIAVAVGLAMDFKENGSRFIPQTASVAK